MKTTFTYSITPADTGKKISQFLSEQGYSSRLRLHLRTTPDCIFVGDTSVFSNHILEEGDILRVELNEKKGSEAIVPVPMKLDILFEDEHLMVVNKSAGMPVHPSQGNYGNTLANGIAAYMEEKGADFVFRAVNRLDRDTSGLLIIAKHMLSSSILSDQVKNHAIHREYTAIVCGKTNDEGTIDAPIARKDGSTIERIVDPERGESAITHYKTLAYNEETDLSYLRLLLETGRTHQIRVHMKHISHPLPGDFLYNPDYRFIKRQALHSAYLRFIHPISGEVMEFTAPLPQDMAVLFPNIQCQKTEVFT
ncbi:MAG: RluA family pseudouridine synthase [Lachnoclostridium sp.]|nr:RluA family pseudouridine synthase [Lachnoclostridium sp.]